MAKVSTHVTLVYLDIIKMDTRYKQGNEYIIIMTDEYSWYVLILFSRTRKHISKAII